MAHQRGPDIKIIDLEDAEKCWSFKGHKKAVNTLSFDPLGQFLVMELESHFYAKAFFLLTQAEALTRTLRYSYCFHELSAFIEL